MFATPHCVVAASVSSALRSLLSDEPAEQRLERFRTVWLALMFAARRMADASGTSLLAETSLQAWTYHLCLATTLGLCCLLRDRDHWSTVRFEVVVNMRRAADDSLVREACFFFFGSQWSQTSLRCLEAELVEVISMALAISGVGTLRNRARTVD